MVDWYNTWMTPHWEIWQNEGTPQDRKHNTTIHPAQQIKHLYMLIQLKTLYCNIIWTHKPSSHYWTGIGIALRCIDIYGHLNLNVLDQLVPSQKASTLLINLGALSTSVFHFKNRLVVCLSGSPFLPALVRPLLTPTTILNLKSYNRPTPPLYPSSHLRSFL